MGEARGGGRLRVDPVACEGIGMCAHLAPDLVDLDRWGYPILAHSDLDETGLAQARRAVRGCPKQALLIRPAGRVG
jgi:ferredoxin